MNMIKTSSYKENKYFIKSNEYYIVKFENGKTKKIIFNSEEELKNYIDNKNSNV